MHNITKARLVQTAKSQAGNNKQQNTNNKQQANEAQRTKRIWEVTDVN